jgi:hypothetical protein
MIHMGSVSIFSLDFSGTRLACSRDFTGGYHLEAGDFVVSMTLDAAAALAQGGAHIRLRAQVAAKLRREMKSGATFRRDLFAVDGRTVHIEIGVTDGGDGVFLEVGAGRMTLTDAQAQLLLAVLDQLGADVTTIRRASERPVPNFGVAQGMREALDRRLPPWAREF